MPGGSAYHLHLAGQLRGLRVCWLKRHKHAAFKGVEQAHNTGLPLQQQMSIDLTIPAKHVTTRRALAGARASIGGLFPTLPLPVALQCILAVTMLLLGKSLIEASTTHLDYLHIGGECTGQQGEPETLTRDGC